MNVLKTPQQPQVIVIGAGPGGYVAAIRLAQLGKRVTVVEREAVGGVCLNWGCIPSKALIHAASVYEQANASADMGIVAENIRLDVPQLQKWKAGVVQKLTGGVSQLLKMHGVQVVRGEATFTGRNELTVSTGDGSSQTLTAQDFLIATGSTPITIPGFEVDGRRVIDSRQALELMAVPKRLAIMGGGVIGLEIGVLYAKLGAEVSIVEMAPQLLPGVDGEIAQQLTRSLKKRGIKVYISTRAKSLDKSQAAESSSNSLKLLVESEKGEVTIEADTLLVSVGRKPNTQSLSLEKAGIKTDAKGFIAVDAQLRTSNPHIFAIGDVCAPPLLAHKASKEGLVAAAVIAGQNEALDYRAMPAAIFTDPEIATVGLTEAEAQAQGREIRVGKFPFQASGRALTMDSAEGFVKLISDAQTDLLLGAHIIGPDAAGLIAEAALAIEMGATAEDIALTVHTHPTLPETLMEAAEASQNMAIHIYQNRKKPGTA